MREFLLLHEKDAKHSKYKSKIKQTLTHVQVMANIRQTLVEYKVMITTESLMYSFLNCLSINLHIFPLFSLNNE